MPDPDGAAAGGAVHLPPGNDTHFTRRRNRSPVRESAQSALARRSSIAETLALEAGMAAWVAYATTIRPA